MELIQTLAVSQSHQSMPVEEAKAIRIISSVYHANEN
jgi:hypothetical protein